MKKWMGVASLAAIAGIGAAAAPVEQRFEAENVLANPEAVVRNSQQKGRWNLWSTDVDAMKKWSGGVVLQGNVISEDAVPGTNVPVLKFRIPVAQNGNYDLKAQVTRTVGISQDGGKNWTKRTGPGTVFSNRALKAGEVVELLIAGDYRDPNGAGAPYIDYFTLIPAAVQSAELKNAGFEASPVGRGPAGWTLWTREKGGAEATVTDDARSGRQAGRIVSSGVKDWAFNNTLSLPVKAGDAFELAAWVKNNGAAAPDAHLQVVSYKNGKVADFSMVSVPLGSAGKEWREFKREFVIPVGVDRISIRVIGDGVCDLALDDFKLASKGNRAGKPEAVKLPGADFEEDAVGQAPKNWNRWAPAARRSS